MASLASCTHVVANQIASELGIDFRDSYITATGMLTIEATGRVLDASTFDINVAGDWFNMGGTFTHNNSCIVTMNSTSGDQNITSSGQSFWDLVLNNTDPAGGTDDIVLTAALVIDNDITITDGQLKATGYNINVGGDWTCGALVPPQVLV